VAFLANVWSPIALSFAVVRLAEASVRAAPDAAAEEAVWLEVNPCKLLVFPVNLPCTVEKLAVA